MSLLRGVFGFLLCVLVSGCASQHRAKELVKNEDFVAHYDTIMQGQEQRSVGAIYAPSASAFLRGDKRARNVGDILTVQLVENTTGASSAKKCGQAAGQPRLVGVFTDRRRRWRAVELDGLFSDVQARGGQRFRIR